jgi:hypothetical protein
MLEQTGHATAPDCGTVAGGIAIGRFAGGAGRAGGTLKWPLRGKGVSLWRARNPRRSPFGREGCFEFDWGDGPVGRPGLDSSGNDEARRARPLISRSVFRGGGE